MKLGASLQVHYIRTTKLANMNIQSIENNCSWSSCTTPKLHLQYLYTFIFVLS